MPSPRGFPCVCGKEYATKQNLLQHQRRYCRGPRNEVEEEVCEVCARNFTTFAGLRLHLKQAHAEVYNSKLQEEARRPPKAWTTDEENSLAMAEAEYNGNELLNHLKSRSSRTLDAIKGRRKLQSYKNKVHRYRQEAERRQSERSEVGEQQRRLESLNNNLREAIRNISSQHLDESTKALRDDILQMPPDVATTKLETWCATLISQYSRRRNQPGERPGQRQLRVFRRKIRDPNLTSRQKRALKFRMAQLKIRMDRRAYANELLDGLDFEEEEVKPNKEDIRVSYQEIFGTASIMDSEAIHDINTNYHEISSPISTEEIRVTLKRMKSGAPGPDGITLEKLKRVNTNKLAMLFNAMLLLEYTPAPLKNSRTTLIPKTKDDLHLTKNWRPITISSVIGRLFGKIMATRLESIGLHSSQRGFTRIDGCFANNTILENIIKHRRKKGQPLSLISLDLQKAFDCVSHNSITRALVRLNIDQKFIHLVTQMYRGATTTISCGVDEVGSFEVKRGVKQGDPMSPFLFNAVLDELICSMNGKSGITLGDGHKVCCLAYADDLILTATTIEDAERMLSESVEFFTKRGLALNVGKCKALSLKTVPSKKKTCVVTTPTFKVGDAIIPQLNIEEEFRYLGRKFSAEGMIPCNQESLQTQLEKITKAPLKPQQKLDILNAFLIPRYIASLQRPNVSAKLLRSVDLKIRTAVKRILHLPLHCNNTIFYAPTKLGGLGIFSFGKCIPIITHSRWTKLEEQNIELRSAFALGNSWKLKLERMIDPEINTTEKVRREFAAKLYDSFSGHGLSEVKNHPASGHIFNRPPRYWGGEEYIKATHLRLNLLPSKSIPYISPDERRCRAGCFKAESLSHILQNCPITHWERILRHNYVQKRLTHAARKDNWKVSIEPHIRGNDGRLRKPDMLLEKGNNIIITDVAVHWEGHIPLNTQYDNKAAIYSEGPFIEKVKELFPNKAIYVLPLVMGARGTWCKRNNTLAKHLQLSYEDILDLITTTMRGGWMTHQAFMRKIWQP